MAKKPTAGIESGDGLLWIPNSVQAPLIPRRTVRQSSVFGRRFQRKFLGHGSCRQSNINEAGRASVFDKPRCDCQGASPPARSHGPAASSKAPASLTPPRRQSQLLAGMAVAKSSKAVTCISARESSVCIAGIFRAGHADNHVAAADEHEVGMKRYRKSGQN